MKSKSLFTKLVAFMLCVIMAISCLPVSAFAAEDWESGLDRVYATAENPLDLTDDMVYEGDFFATVNVPAGETYYFMSYGLVGMNMQINGGEEVMVSGNPRMPYTWNITNDGAEDADYTITAAFPVGSMDNPDEAELGDNVATVAEGSQGYNWKYTAEKDGDLIITVNAAPGWTYTINNMTTYAYGDTQWSDSDPVVNPATITVAAGDEIQIIANTYDVANPWAAPAGNITVNLAYAVECEYVDANQDGRCDLCGEEKLDDTLAFYGKAMVLGADIRGIFQVRKMKETSPYESFKVIVEKNGVETELELVATSDKSKHTTYGFAMTVAAKEMADVVNARIVGITADGKAFISNPDAWSIKIGAITLMEGYAAKTDADSQNRLKMIANMLNYGAEAQNRFGYNLDNLATKDIGEFANYIITEPPVLNSMPKVDDTGVTSTLKQIAFNLDAKAEIVAMFKVPKADAKEIYSADIVQTHTAPDGTVMTKEYTIEGKDCLKSGTTLGVYINNLESDEMRDVLSVTVKKNGVVVSATQVFSGESALVDGLLNTYPDLANALMNYADCAYAVFGHLALSA